MAQQSDKLRLLRRIPDIKFEEEANGYSRDQVNRVLANLAPLADEIERLQTRLQEAEQRAASAEARLIEARSPSQVANGAAAAPAPDFDETLRNTLVNAQRTADTLVREAKEEAERLRNEAEFQSNALLADAREQADEMTTDAVAQRERLLAEAAAERAKMLDEAREEAQHKVAAVEEELIEAHDGERTRLLEQIAELQQIHNTLQGDVDRFESHLEIRRADVRAALDDLNGVLDGAEALRAADAPEPEDVGPVDAADYPDIEVQVEALEHLEGEADQALAETARPTEALMPEELDELAPADPKALNGQVNQVTGTSTGEHRIEITDQHEAVADGDDAGDENYQEDQGDITGEVAVTAVYADNGIDQGMTAAAYGDTGGDEAAVTYTDGGAAGDGNIAAVYADTAEDGMVAHGYTDGGFSPSEEQAAHQAVADPYQQMADPYQQPVADQYQPVAEPYETHAQSNAHGMHGYANQQEPVPTAHDVEGQAPTGDPFLDELRRVTTEEPGVNDPITDFLEDDGTQRSGGGWFGRRK